MDEETSSEVIKELWAEHESSSFPRHLGGKDVNGIDFDMLVADISGCVHAYLDRKTLDTWRTAILGLCYHHCEFVVPILNEEAATYYWRLGRIAELILEEIVKDGDSAVKREGAN